MRFAHMKMALALFLTVSVVADNTGCKSEEEAFLAFPTVFDACVKYCACIEDLGSTCVERCILDYRYSRLSEGGFEVPESHFKCLAEAQGCDGVAACIECENYDGYCEGNVAVSCIYGKVVRKKCSKDQRCQADEDHYYPFCESTEECTEQGSWCEGAVVMHCDGEVLQKMDCRDSGLENPTCVLGSNGGAHCASKPLTPCEGYGSYIHCQANQLVECLNGFAARYDCSKMGWDSQCTETSERVYCRIPNTVSCDSRDGYCENNNAYMCVDSALMVFNCTLLGQTCWETYNKVACRRID